MKRVFLYVRVSTEEQALHGLSIEAQTAALQVWAQTNGHKVVGVYTDAGVSARKPASKRPELQRLLGDVRAGKGELIVFTKLDRWFRNIAEYYKVQEVLEKHHVDWRTIHEDYDTSTASGRLKINIMLSVAQDEADRASERIKAINEMKRQKREPLTGDCMPGYKIEGKKYVKDPDLEDAVNGFFRTYLARGSISAAMNEAERLGLKLQYQRAHKMLESTAYYGRYFDADGMTPPYITKEQFETIQTMRRRIVRKSPKNRVYIFSGLVVCGECGKRMSGQVNTNQESYYYNCHSHYLRCADCSNRTNLSQRKIEAFLMGTIREKMEQQKAELESRPRRKQRDYRGEITVLRGKIDRLKDLYVNDIITLEQCRADQRIYLDKIESLQKESSETRRPKFEEAERILSAGWEIVYNLLGNEQKQEFWRILIQEIRIYPDRHIEYDLRL
ncbi:MAG: recombinase family protein [Oscillospiraceae bacterium]|nr:recombinase family protein [Oscillospiraceae bacterium]